MHGEVGATAVTAALCGKECPAHASHATFLVPHWCAVLAAAALHQSPLQVTGRSFMPLASSKKPDGNKWRKEPILQTRGSKFIKFQEARIQVGAAGVGEMGILVLSEDHTVGSCNRPNASESMTGRHHHAAVPKNPAPTGDAW